jgi:hypothetical protein
MGNCDLVAARSLIDFAASRLALRAPALRAEQRRFWRSPGSRAAAQAAQRRGAVARVPHRGRGQL